LLRAHVTNASIWVVSHPYIRELLECFYRLMPVPVPNRWCQEQSNVAGDFRGPSGTNSAVVIVIKTLENVAVYNMLNSRLQASLD